MLFPVTLNTHSCDFPVIYSQLFIHSYLFTAIYSQLFIHRAKTVTLAQQKRSPRHNSLAPLESGLLHGVPDGRF
jgi:hypothetical protein